jgi:hypothetical protein
MSKAVASKGTWVTKQYHKKDMRSEFPENVLPSEAIDDIYRQYGMRPETPLHTDHSFAEIVGTKLVPVSPVAA